MPVVNMACPKCKREATEYDANKWKCLHCGIKFLYEKPMPRPSVSVTKVVRRSGSEGDRELFNSEGGRFVVTTSRVKWDNLTIPISNISSVAYWYDEPPKELSKKEEIKILVWLAGFSAIFYAFGAKSGEPLDENLLHLTGSLFAIVSVIWLVIIIVSNFISPPEKPRHHLRLVLNSGDPVDLVAHTREFHTEFEQAILTAMGLL